MFIGLEWQEARRELEAQHRVFGPAVGSGGPEGCPQWALACPVLVGVSGQGLRAGPGCRASPAGWEPVVSREGGAARRGHPSRGQSWRKDGFDVGHGVSSGSQQNNLCVWTPLTHLLAHFTFLFFLLWESYFKLCLELT